MASLRKATPEDFSFVLPLLTQFKNELDPADYRRLFTDTLGEGYIGYLLEDAGKPVGFLSYVFSRRPFGGKEHIFCNLSCWIVLEPYRHQSLSLLMPALRIKGATLTNFTPTPEVFAISKKLGFTTLAGKQRILLPVPKPRLRLSRTKIFTSTREAGARVDRDQARIIEDHSLPHHRHVVVETPDGRCLLVLNRVKKRVRDHLKVPFLRVHHVSNFDVFSKTLPEIVTRCALSFGAVAMLAEERYLRGCSVPVSFPRPKHAGMSAFKSDTLRAEDIDGLYSELVLLNY